MFAYVLIVVTIAIAISALAERRNLQPALVVVMVGLAASYIPGIPRLELEPEFILSIVLPPMLFSAARDFSFAEFRRQMGPITSLGVFLVFATTFVVAGAALLALPELVPIAALILGVVVAPPDAVTATTIGRRAGLPTGLMSVLKGESLINDAAALTLFAVLIATATGTHAFIDSLPLYFLYAATVGIIVGVIIGNLVQWTRRRLASPALSTALSVIVPFAAYLTAEELHASGVLAVVAAGFAVGHHGVQAGYKERMQEGAFWRTTDTLLETFVFAYIAVQLRFVITDADQAGFDIGELAITTLAVFLASVLMRFIWVFATAGVRQLTYRRHLERYRRSLDGTPISKPQRPLTWRENIVLGWTGMRGVVTLAAAAGVPAFLADGSPFPGDDAILAVAFLFTIATLLIQGLTLPGLIRLLKLEDPSQRDFVAEQRQLAEALVHEATTSALDSYSASHPGRESQRLIAATNRRLRHEGNLARHSERDASEALELGKVLLEARRIRLVAARDNLELDDTIVREMLEKLDIEQAFMDSMSEPG